MTLHQFCEWLSNTPVSMTVQNVTWIIPTVQTVHIVCIAVVIGSMAMLDLRLFGIAGLSDSVSGTARRLLPWVWWSLPVLLLTGIVLIIGEPPRELENPTFIKKMLLLVAAIVVTAGFQSTLRKDVGFWEATPGRRIGAKVLAVVSIALWIAIVFAGRLIAYTDHP